MSRMEKAMRDGLIAGLAMAMVAMVYAFFQSGRPLRPVRLIGGTLEGEAATSHPTSSVLAGSVVHMVVSMLTGVTFMPILRLVNFRGAVSESILGAVYATFVWGFNEVVTMPLVDPLMARRMPALPFLVAHIVYGVTLGALFSMFGPRVNRPLVETPRELVGFSSRR